MDGKKKVSSKKNKGNGVGSINRFNIFWVDLQIIMTIVTIIVFVLFLFNSELWTYLQLSLGVSLLVMAYNNQRIYKRAKVTVLYLIVGVVLLILDFLMLLGI